MSEPKTHTRTFQVRNYECDPYGHMNNVNYLRYMQETAFDASASVGYDFAKYHDIGLTWMIRETEIDYIRPLHYQELVEVKTWIGDFRKIRSKRFYEFRRPGEDALVARAATDWVLLDAATQHPAQIPDEMREAFWPGSAEIKQPRPTPFPAPPEPPAQPYVHRQQVTWSDLDGFHHLNNANYLKFIENAGTNAARHFGWGLKQMLDLGLGWVQKSLRIEYKGQPRLDDVLEITTFLQEVRRTVTRRWYFMRDVESGDLISRAYIDFVIVNVESGRPARAPEGLKEAFTEHRIELED